MVFANLPMLSALPATIATVDVWCLTCNSHRVPAFHQPTHAGSKPPLKLVYAGLTDFNFLWQVSEIDSTLSVTTCPDLTQAEGLRASLTKVQN